MLMNELQARIALRFIQRMKDLRAAMLQSDKEYTELAAKTVRLELQLRRAQGAQRG